CAGRGLHPGSGWCPRGGVPTSHPGERRRPPTSVGRDTSHQGGRPYRSGGSDLLPSAGWREAGVLAGAGGWGAGGRAGAGGGVGLEGGGGSGGRRGAGGGGGGVGGGGGGGGGGGLAGWGVWVAVGGLGPLRRLPSRRPLRWSEVRAGDRYQVGRGVAGVDGEGGVGGAFADVAVANGEHSRRRARVAVTGGEGRADRGAQVGQHRAGRAGVARGGEVAEHPGEARLALGGGALLGQHRAVEPEHLAREVGVVARAVVAERARRV